MPPHGLEPKGTPASISTHPHNRKAEVGTSAANGGLPLPPRGSAVTLGPTSHKATTCMRCWLDRQGEVGTARGVGGQLCLLV